MGARTPGKPVKGEPPKGMGEGGPKVTPAPLPTDLSPIIDRFPGKGTTGDSQKPDPSIFGTLIGGPAPIKTGGPAPKSPGGLFGQLMEGIKKTDKFKNRGPGGLGGFPGDLPPLEERKDYYEKNKDNNIVDNPLNTPGYGSRVDNPFGIYTADFRDSDFDGVDDRDQRGPGQPKIKFGKEVNIDKRKKAGMQAPPDYTPRSAYKDEMESVLRESKGSRTDDVVNRIREIEERERERRAGRSPNRFPMGGNERDDSPFSQERFDSYRAGFRPRKKEAVFFGEREPSSGSKRPTKKGMRKAGPEPSPEAKNKFEEMLAYMKSFQK